MIGWTLKKIFGTKNAREVKRMQPLVERANQLEQDVKPLSDDDLRARTAELRRRIDNGAKLDDLLPEAFAVVREAAVRTIGQRHYDVQLLGGIALHRGVIAEMKTGEGKTLVATLPSYLNALAGRGVHVVTVNDYLARRDAEWMGKIHKFLGLQVGCVVHGLTDRERQQAYRADVTYGMNSEFGFDYLRDNIKTVIDRVVQRDLYYAIVDEADSILIDEARTPLIISGPAEQAADLYHRVDGVIPSLKKDVDYVLDEKAHAAMLTDAGVERVQKKLNIANLYDPDNLAWLHHVEQALKAHTLYKRDVQYVVEAGKVIIIDEFTGRKMPGRRWSDGLHQAIEAKENLEIEEENQTIATVSYQNYFRMYEKLAGMTGTAETEAEEFHKIYKLDVTVIPTNKPMVRKDHDDVIWKSERGKFKAILEEIGEVHDGGNGRPILVGTVSVEKSEVLSQLLRRRGIRHNVLNAKHHEQEAGIVAQAGRLGAVTISTNMAGRGTDILLGGNSEYLAREQAGAEPDIWDPKLEPETRAERRREHAEWKQRYAAALARVEAECRAEHDRIVALGGLHILGSERHESRRIDNQLRGRSGRQGDPGSSRFHLSLEDDLMRIFGADRMTGLMERLGMEEDTPIEHPWVNRSIRDAQQRVEGMNFDSRKNLLEYDDVLNQQRKTIYALRRQILEGRYRRELTEEETKRGDALPPPPDKSGDLSVELLGDRLRAPVTRMIDDMAERHRADRVARAKAEEADGGPPAPDPASLPWAIDPVAVRSLLYHRFGAAIDLARVAERREEAIRKAVREIAASLIQQRERLLDLGEELVFFHIGEACPERVHPEEWDLGELAQAVGKAFHFECRIAGLRNMDREEIAEKVWDQVEKVIEAREAEMGTIALLFFFRNFYLEEIDSQWIDHLRIMQDLRDGIGLRGYGQRDPKKEYKKEGYALFTDMMARIRDNVADKLFRVHVERKDEVAEYKHKERRTMEGGAAREKVKTVKRDTPKVGRNDPCPCGSGKKYKRCCALKVASA